MSSIWQYLAVQRFSTFNFDLDRGCVCVSRRCMSVCWMVGRDVCIIEALPLISRRRECLTFKRLLFHFLLVVLGGDCRGMPRRVAVDNCDTGKPQNSKLQLAIYQVAWHLEIIHISNPSLETVLLMHELMHDEKQKNIHFIYLFIIYYFI